VQNTTAQQQSSSVHLQSYTPDYGQLGRYACCYVIRRDEEPSKCEFWYMDEVAQRRLSENVKIGWSQTLDDERRKREGI
jgi:hypothetical protein